MYISLYRRYRPQTFSDMVGQSAAVGVLLESLREGSLGHAYLFSGPRGCGKTSAARLVAKSLDCSRRDDNCEPCGECENCRAIAAGEHLDVIEIDGASNRGIGEIRDLKSHVSLKALSAAYKVYIIDEVHMLTDAAFNALLKTLEEPPANVVFLLATTEPHKVPVTIRSRCQHIPFHRITIADTVARLKYVCSQENIAADDEAVWEIARQSDGALRDALSLTEQAVALGRGSLSVECVRDLTGGSSRSELEKWVSQLRTAPNEAAASLAGVMAHGVSPERLCEALFVLFRDLWLYSMWKEKALDALETSEAEKAYLAAESAFWDKEKLRAACALCNRLMPRAHYGMKGDVFSGLVYMGLLDILSGDVPRLVPPPAAPVPAHAVPTAAPLYTQQERQVAAHRAPVQQEAPSLPPEEAQPEEDEPYIPFAPADLGEAYAAQERPVLAQAQAYDASELCARLGDNEFSRLIGKLDTDRLAIAAALLDAELCRSDGSLEVRFERPAPARNFLAIPKIRKALVAAAAKMWGIEAEGGEENKQAPSSSSGKIFEEAAAPVKEAGRAAKQTEEETPEDEAHSLAAHVLRLAGAELLYVESDAADDEPDAEQI